MQNNDWMSSQRMVGQSYGTVTVFSANPIPPRTGTISATNVEHRIQYCVQYTAVTMSEQSITPHLTQYRSYFEGGELWTNAGARYSYRHDTRVHASCVQDRAQQNL